MKKTVLGLLVFTVAVLAAGGSSEARGGALLRLMLTGADVSTVAADTLVTQLARSGDLRPQSVQTDPAMPGRTAERFQQVYQGIAIFGAEIVRDTERGLAHSVFGSLVQDLDMSVTPRLGGDDVIRALTRLAGASGRIVTNPVLVILSRDGEYLLAYTSVVAADGDVFRVFLDASTGAELERISEIQRQAAIGQGRGVLGDMKKVSAAGGSGSFFADDMMRPPTLVTFDLRGSLARARSVVEGGAPLFASDRASDTDNNWGDPAAVDAHVNIGWTYDYYFKRFGRRGLDNRDRPIVTLIHGVSQHDALSLPASLNSYATNAFWCDSCGPGAVGVMYFGDGIPPGVYEAGGGQNIGYLAGALDVAAHELTHAVVSSSSRLLNRGEPGALNEAFADMMGTGAEFFYQSAGDGIGQADYLVAEDVVRGVVPGSLHGVRSLANPLAYGLPDHYSRRYLGPADAGGVHVNSAIASHAFYLAIEGGTDRTSGLSVQGVGAANREQIERVFYRAFVFLLPSTATFQMARATTVQAARDLYGGGSPAERAVTQAWTAVGVN